MRNTYIIIPLKHRMDNYDVAQPQVIIEAL